MRRHDASIIALTGDGAAPFLMRALRAITRSVQGDGAVLLSQTGDQIDILADYGIPLHMQRWSRSGSTARSLIRQGGQIDRADKVPDFHDCPAVAGAPYWRSLHFTPIETMLQDTDVAVCVGSRRPRLPEIKAPNAEIAKDLYGIIEDEFKLIADIVVAIETPATAGENKVREDPQDQVHDANTIVRFLSDTLISRDRVLSRNGILYHALNTWRKVIKDEQIAALKAIKPAPMPALERAVAKRISDWIERHFGRKRFDWIVPVPCGHSGADCLSRRIAQQLAEVTGVAMKDAFDPLMVSGSSHPRTNRRRPRMRLREALSGDILLIDDVATSGAHIEEGVKKLRNEDNSVVAVAWIADA